MSDAEYDALESQLRASDPKASSLQKPGHDSITGRVKHAQPMLSIENKYADAEVLEWVAKLPSGTSVSIEPKFDGISVSLRYLNGKLWQALTRGDGDAGEDITIQVRATKIPQTIGHHLGNLEIRGELVMRNSTLERINKALIKEGKKVYASTRNLTAGTMKTSDLKVVADREIEIRPWDVIGNPAMLPQSASARLALLKKEGFPEPLITVFDSSNPRALLEGMRKKLEERETVLRVKHSLETDGVVIKVDNTSLREKLGVSSKYTNYQVCFKPQSASATTILKGIVWQIGRQGKLTPVAEVEPVTLAGALVQRASLNNITWITEMGLMIGAKVEILRSGDVIPIITRAIDTTGAVPVCVPEFCPECSTKLIIWTDPSSEITTHWCPNETCRGRLKDYFTFVADREYLEIDNLGPEMANVILDNHLASDLAELFEMGNDFQEIFTKGGGAGEKLLLRKGFSVANTRKMAASMMNAKTADWDRWIASLGISMIGRSLGKILAKEFNFQPEDFKLNFFVSLSQISLKTIEGLGERKIKEIQMWASNPKNQELCKRLYDAGVRPTGTKVAIQVGGSPLAGLTFVITGGFNENRDSITAKLESLGAKSQSGVSKKTGLLIVGNSPGKGKTDKARELGTKKVGVEYLVEVFTKSGVTFDAGDFELAEKD